MRWKNTRRSNNVEDLRGSGSRGKRRGVGGVLGIVIVLGAMYFGVDPKIVMSILGGGQTSGYSNSAPRPTSAKENIHADFTSAVLATTEDTWSHQFTNQLNQSYVKPKLVLFHNQVRSGCGNASASMGPFYCPADQKMYIDLSFYDELEKNHNAGGDFARAYVIAHEVGHHIQTLLGISSKVHQARQKLSKIEGNKLSVKQELQADCFAGIWAHHINTKQQLLERGDLEEALNAAIQIGDDTLQRKAQGHVVEEAFTHGTGKQRAYWFNKGFESGQMSSCNTFN
ncbi:MAG: zinc metallopeptidase [Gammaproteobacteria bacterium]|nr:zinc metallopeptidase [Gammaproteobacteria bacterium]